MEFWVTLYSLALDNEEQNIVKLLAISQTIDTVCWDDDYSRSHILRAYCNKHFESIKTSELDNSIWATPK